MNWREEKAYAKGALARRLGENINANPYTHETAIQSANHWAWRRGFVDQSNAAQPVLKPLTEVQQP